MRIRTFRYHNKVTDSYEVVEPEMWRWRANYDDGTFIEQFDSFDRFHRIEEIDSTRLQVFLMQNTETGKTISIKFPTGATPMHFYVRGGQVGDPRSSYTIYVFGYELQAQKTLMAILPDGNVAHINDPEDIKLLSWEKRYNL
jgi:hypothetical protein